MESFEIVLWNSELDMRSLRKVVRVKSTPGTATNACFSLSTDKSQVNPVTLTVLWYISANRQSCVFLILYSVEILVIETFPSLTFLSHWEKKYLYVYVNRTLIIYWIQDHILIYKEDDTTLFLSFNRFASAIAFQDLAESRVRSVIVD